MKIKSFQLGLLSLTITIGSCISMVTLTSCNKSQTLELTKENINNYLSKHPLIHTDQKDFSDAKDSQAVKDYITFNVKTQNLINGFLYEYSIESTYEPQPKVKIETEKFSFKITFINDGTGGGGWNSGDYIMISFKDGLITEETYEIWPNKKSSDTFLWSNIPICDVYLDKANYGDVVFVNSEDFNERGDGFSLFPYEYPNITWWSA